MSSDSPRTTSGSEPAAAQGAAPVADTYGEQVERLFRAHNESLVRFLRARLPVHEAKEVAQEAYLQLLGIDTPGTVSFLQAYLFRTAANLATNRLKQRGTRRRIDELVFFETPQEVRSPEPTWAARQELELINRAIQELPAHCRLAFAMVKFDDLSIEVVAQRMGLHPRRVRRYVARAIAHCQDALSQAQSRQGRSK